MATTQSPVPLQAPPQPVKTEPGAGVADRVTAVPAANGAVQVAPQLMPRGAESTLPWPVPARFTASEMPAPPSSHWCSAAL
ncbi:hypothetical protein RAMLITH_16455 [Ramlibacter sp. RBP-2]|uniref:Uncharacterized protein n=1 Tax=Ramlibacter lithotrophicus TaxID=2606681 RepID=A0A7X6I7L5_9BURK|nr:hypothetical protein [Ramlibacter lithotrophicus]